MGGAGPSQAAASIPHTRATMTASGSGARRLVASYRSARSAFLAHHRRWERASPFYHADERGAQQDAQQTIEHVVPRSVLIRRGHDEADRDMHNFVVYPRQLNQVRGVSRFADEARVLDVARGARSDALRIYDASGTPLPPPWMPDALAQHADVFRAEGWFAPPRAARGRIARAVAYMCLAYPGLRRVVATDDGGYGCGYGCGGGGGGTPLNPGSSIIDMTTLRAWHERYPVTPAETRLDAWIARVQGAPNPFVRRPDLLHAELRRVGAPVIVLDHTDDEDEYEEDEDADADETEKDDDKGLL